MKLKYVIAWLSLLLFNAEQGHAQSWPWAKAAGGDSIVPTNYWGWFPIQEVGANCCDPSGNVYATGYFGGMNIVFDSINLNASWGGLNIFLVKYNPNGKVIWAKIFGQTNTDGRGLSVCSDASGNILLTGSYRGRGISFGTTAIHSTQYDSTECFLTKFDPAGNVLWAKGYGGKGDNESVSVSTDPAGNAFVTGYFTGAKMTLGTTILSNHGKTNVFLAKFDPAGAVLWANSAGGTRDDEAVSVSADRQGNAVITGSFTSPTLSFGPYTVNRTGRHTLFLAKYDGSGNALWAKSPGGHGNNAGEAVCTDLSGNIYIGGEFDSLTTVLGSVVLNSSVTSSGSGLDAFVAKFNASGTVAWVSEIKGAGPKGVYSICADPQNEVFVSGYFYFSSVTFGTHTVKALPGSMDPAFIAKYDSTGYNVCASSLTSGGDDANAVCVDNQGNAFLEGDFGPDSLDVGPDTLVCTTSRENLFVAKYSCNCLFGAHTYGAPEICEGAKEVISVSGGNYYYWNTGDTTQHISVSPVTTTNYTVIVTFGYCADTAYKTVVVNPLPVIAVTAQQIDLCEGGHTGSVSTVTGSGTSPYIFSWSPNGEQTPDLTGLAVGSYQMYVSDSKGCKADVKVQISSTELFVPDYFSPNGDGMNDKLCIYGNCLSNVSFSIFDRWGEKVFETTDPSNCWDGFYHGQLMESQALVYHLKATLPDGQAIEKKGTLNLQR